MTVVEQQRITVEQFDRLRKEENGKEELLAELNYPLDANIELMEYWIKGMSPINEEPLIRITYEEKRDDNAG